MAQTKPLTDPLDPTRMASLKHWGKPPEADAEHPMRREATVDCGWGRLIFGQTYDDPARLAATLQEEQTGQRDIALYIRDPHLVLSHAPLGLFLDPSFTYRLDLSKYADWDSPPEGLIIRPVSPDDREAAINRIFLARGMVPAYHGFYERIEVSQCVMVLLALDAASGEVVGAVTGVDHKLAFDDQDDGSSLWALAVDPQATVPAVGEALTRALIGIFRERGRRFMDVSVLHDNAYAIALYDKLEFERVPAYCIKKKNTINEHLFLGPDPDEHLNAYARIITDEARRRGIGVEVLDAEGGFFRLTLGGRSVTCRESLSELTSAVAMSRCDDKAVTRRLLAAAGLRVPAQVEAADDGAVEAFVKAYRRVVVKPARGEQGRGIRVDLHALDEVRAAIDEARQVGDRVLVEEYVRGEDLRVIVIDNQVVAAAVRRPAQIKGDGTRTIRDLIAKQSRRRAAATQGESTIPVDAETHRCVNRAGYELDDVLADGVVLRVRKTANLHTGGTIHDVTECLHPTLARDAVRAAEVLEIPVVGLDFMVPDLEGPDYVAIEANERPGLANHEPQPTAERFIDLLFPFTRAYGT